ncbi:PREDICTED: non-specific lipid-transfer protein 1-like isoform X2 [Nicotiana attenuata]|uniref:Non-specific lipid-transfer protein n=2 Tax=Nicotiana attenuata TaxID=49451 RepID=A0A1J6IUD7_NICAT|nr:PREDICTED: non-specific lipid-transfer protein 1-like isoform X2 [Nicotiana attenuata]OIT07876.1 non-specific lipid-transfer protein 1 [Nicotiana attenuata]
MKPTYTFLLVTILMMFLLFPITSNGETRIQCSNVVGAVRPCVVFFRGGSGVTGMPPAACCAGISTLSKMAAKNIASRQAVCRCVQSAIKNLRATDATVKALPRRCGVTLPFTFSPNVKCPG